MFLISTFVVLASLILITAAEVTRFLLPAINAIPSPSVTLLFPVEFFPEKEIPIYALFVVCTMVSSLVIFLQYPRIHRIIKSNPLLFQSWSLAITLFLLLNPHSNLISITIVVLPLFLLLFLCLVVSHVIPARSREKIIDICLTLTIIKYLVPQVLAYTYATIRDALSTNGVHVLLIGFFLFITAKTYPRIFSLLKKSVTKKVIIVICFVCTIMLIGKSMVIVPAYSGDMFFTLLPAYHLVHGGTALVNIISQYGVLYLLPWALVFSLFPSLPITYLSGVLLNAVFLVCFFVLFGYVTNKFIKNRFVWMFTFLGTLYYSLLIHIFDFGVDSASLIGAPAFTPLRFGAFILPLFFLVLFVKNQQTKHIRLFLLLSCLGWFFSFDIGTGLLFAGIGTYSLSVFLSSRPTVLSLLRTAGEIILTVALVILLAFLYTEIKSGRLPDISQFLLFSKIFSSGLMMAPVGGERVYQLPVIFSLVTLGMGLFFIIRRKQSLGLLLVYLAMIDLSMMTYYFGRSLYPTLFGTSLPFVVEIGVLLDLTIEHWQQTSFPLAYSTFIFLSGFLLTSGSLRIVKLTAHVASSPKQFVSDVATFSRNALTAWPIKETPQYTFLNKTLPPDCTVLLLDRREQELLPALRRLPALPYSFSIFIIPAKEQVDTLTLSYPKKPVCIFRGSYDRNDPDSIIYDILWNKYRSGAQLLAQDKILGYSLYLLKK